MGGNMKKHRGIILWCTLVIMVILSVFLMVGVYRMQSSAMVTKKAIWEIKSYWTARAGNTIVADGCLRSKFWPKTKKFLSDAGTYHIEKSEGDVVKGVDTETGCNFSIHYINHLFSSPGKKFSSDNVNEPALSWHFSEMLRKYADRDAEYDNALNDYKNATTKNTEKLYKYLTQELYAITVGKSGPSICPLELVYGLNTGVSLDNSSSSSSGESGEPSVQTKSITATAAIRVGGTMNVSVKELLNIDQTVGSRPCIVANNVILSNGKGAPDPYGPVAIDIGEGAIFTKSCTINGKSIDPSYSSSNITNFGINVYPIGNDFNLSVNNSYAIPEGLTIPSGTFCFIELPKEYNEKEFTATVDGLSKLYLSVDQFWDIYFKSMFADAALDNLFTPSGPLGSLKKLVDIIMSDDGTDSIKVSDKYCDGTYDANKIFNDKFEGDDGIFEKGFKKIDSSGGIIGKLLNFVAKSAFRDKLKKEYKKYLVERIDNSIKQYTQSTMTGKYKEYEPFFIPDHYLDIHGSLENWYSNLNLSYETMTKGRIYGDFAKAVDAETPTDVSSNLLTKVITDFLSLDPNSDDEKYILKENFKNVQQSQSSAYLSKSVTCGDGGYLNVIEKMSDYTFGKDTTSYKFPVYKAQELSFVSDNKELLMNINVNLKSTGVFNFATFERAGENKYRQAEDRRAGIVFEKASATDKPRCGISATDIDILGTVEGTGTLQASNDIMFEAVGSSLKQNENYVALLAGNDIKLKRVSAGNASVSFSDTLSDYRGVFSSGGNLVIDGKGINKFSLRGTIICAGNMIVSDIVNFDVTYDPKLSGIMLQYIDTNWDDTFDYMETAIESEDEEATQTHYVSTGTFKVFNRI